MLKSNSGRLTRRSLLKSTAATGAAAIAGVGGVNLFNVRRSLAQTLPDPASVLAKINVGNYVKKDYRELYKLGDNEGVLSTLPAIGNVLMGALAGQWLRSARTPGIKVLGLFLASAISLTAGYLWSFEFPLNKILWTSSFVLVTGGCSLSLLGVFYGLIDVLGYRRWAFFFTVIGMNAITIYVAQRFIDFTKISQFFLGGVAQHLGTALEASHSPTEVEAAQKFVLAVGVIAAEWLFLWHLYRHKIFLKV